MGLPARARLILPSPGEADGLPFPGCPEGPSRPAPEFAPVVEPGRPRPAAEVHPLDPAVPERGAQDLMHQRAAGVDRGHLGLDPEHPAVEELQRTAEVAEDLGGGEGVVRQDLPRAVRRLARRAGGELIQEREERRRREWALAALPPQPDRRPRRLMQAPQSG